MSNMLVLQGYKKGGPKLYYCFKAVGMQESRSAFNFPRDCVSNLLLVSNSEIFYPLQEVPQLKVGKHLLWNRHPQVFMNV